MANHILRNARDPGLRSDWSVIRSKMQRNRKLETRISHGDATALNRREAN